MADAEFTTGTEKIDPAVLDALAIDMRTAGFCLECRRLVERNAQGGCPAGHDASAIVGSVQLRNDRELPQVPSFNWGAFFMPMIWGPAHGLWAGAVLFPVWLFADSIIMSAYKNGGALVVAAVVVVALTLLFMFWFARTASIPAYLRMGHKMTIPQFNARQRVWGIVGAVFFITLLALATYFNVYLYDAVKAAANT